MSDNAHTIRILGAGAPRTGVINCAKALAADTGQHFEFEHATAPIIKERVMSGNVDADIIEAPLAVIEELVDAGHIVPDSVTLLGVVSVGVVVPQRRARARPFVG